MSSPSPKVVAYLRQQLARNPIHEGGQIVALRAKAFKLSPNGSAPEEKPVTTSDRQQVRQQVENVRAQCFTAPVEQLESQLDALPLANYPDLAALSDRLRVVLASRGKLPQLSTDKRFDGDFFSCLKKVLVEPPRDVAVLREQVLSSFRHRKNRKRGQAMIRLLKQELPELYALEQDWLESLLRYSRGKHAAPLASQTAAAQSSSNWHWGIWVVVILAGPLIRGCARMTEENDSPRRSRSSISTPNTYQSPIYDPNKSVRKFEQDRANSASQAAQEMAERHRQFMKEQDEIRERMRREREKRWERIREDQSRMFDEMEQRHDSTSLGPPDSLPGGFARPRVVPLPGSSVPSSPTERPYDRN